MYHRYFHQSIINTNFKLWIHLQKSKTPNKQLETRAYIGCRVKSTSQTHTLTAKPKLEGMFLLKKRISTEICHTCY